MSDTEKITPEALFEALLFVASQPVTVEQLAETVSLSEVEATAVLKKLEAHLSVGGLRLQNKAGKVQLITAPEAAPYVERLLGLEVNLRLSQAALEALSIVAYAQPITRPQIEAIRGVNSDHVLRTLVSAGLVEVIGRAQTLGRPMLYETTFEFLQQFGLKSVDDLPPLQPLDKDPEQGQGKSQNS